MGIKTHTEVTVTIALLNEGHRTMPWEGSCLGPQSGNDILLSGAGVCFSFIIFRLDSAIVGAQVPYNMHHFGAICVYGGMCRYVSLYCRNRPAVYLSAYMQVHQEEFFLVGNLLVTEFALWI